MAFPTTSVLTTFPGADEEPLSEGGAWGGTIRTTTATRVPLALSSNRAAPGASGTPSQWESVFQTTFGADMECYVTQTGAPTTAGNGPAVWLRVQSEGAAGADGYNLSYVFGTGLQFYRMVDSSFTQLGSTVVQVVAAGDSFGLSVIGTTLEGWYKPSAGAWTSIGTRSDGNITGSGKIALAITGGSGTPTRLDDFGGGSIATGITVAWITA